MLIGIIFWALVFMMLTKDISARVRRSTMFSVLAPTILISAFIIIMWIPWIFGLNEIIPLWITFVLSLALVNIWLFLQTLQANDKRETFKAD